MAKNFPYFKFVATEWLTGNIAFEDLEVQGLFINICSLYWQRDGVLTLEELKRRYKREDLIDKLIEGDFLESDEDSISIQFLDEQLVAANHVSKRNSINGASGGRPVKVKDGEQRLYILKCFDEFEQFYKVGITHDTISRIYSNNKGNTAKMPYSFTIIKDEIFPFDLALFLENSLLKKLKKHTPIKSFKGNLECININEDILTELQSLILLANKPTGLFQENETKANLSKEEEEKEKKKKENTSNATAFDFDNLLAFINKSFGRNFKLINQSVKKSFNARLKDGYSKKDIIVCIENLVKNQYHKENGYQYCTPEFLSRSSTLEKYGTKTSVLPNKNQIQQTPSTDSAIKLAL